MRRQLGAGPQPASTYPNAYSVARLESYKAYWLKNYPPDPAKFTPAVALQTIDPLTGLTNECRLTILWGRSGPSTSPPPPYPFRDEVWAAKKDVDTLADGYRVLVKKGVPRWEATLQARYHEATVAKGVRLFDELITSMRTFEERQAAGPPLMGSLGSLVFWGVAVYLFAVDNKRRSES